MSDGEQGMSAWARYLKAAIDQPSWNVAKLARQSGIHRATIFRWMKGEGGNVTVDSVRRIAIALGDDPDAALRVAGELVNTPPPPSAGRDEEMDLIDRAPVDAALKDSMRRKLQERRERERQARLADLQDMIDVAKRSEG
jgi:transcriptional regulator with XRE-family HTH domain